ncbi:MAG: relaxase/mobilization nuclease domain-containing protein [Alistipes communis]
MCAAKPRPGCWAATEQAPHLSRSIIDVPKFPAQDPTRNRKGRRAYHAGLPQSRHAQAHRRPDAGTGGSYMERMGIVDTQYIVARHNDTEHPHLHIVYNRVRYDKKLVLDKHERRRNVKACRELKLRLGLTFAKGKEHVKIERLRNADKIKYQIYEAIGRVLPECQRDGRPCAHSSNGKESGCTLSTEVTTRGKRCRE